MQLQILHILAIHQDFSGGRIIETGNQTADRGFSRPAGSSQGHVPAGGDIKGNVLENRHAVFVGKGHIVE